MNILIEKLRLPTAAGLTSTHSDFRNKFFKSISLVAIVVTSFLVLWYLFEVYYIFNLGFAIRERQDIAKKLEVEYIKDQNDFLAANAPEAIRQSAIVMSMTEVSSIKYLKSQNFFVEASQERSKTSP